MNTAVATNSRFYFEQEMEAPEIIPVCGGTAAVYSHRSPDKETCNEDAAAVIPVGDSSAVLIVADGLGGSAAGEKASRLATEAIEAAVVESDGSENLLRTAILNGFEEANATVRKLGNGGATTLAVLEISGEMIRPYHVGDSGILITGGRGKLKLQTLCHSPVGYGVEAGLIDEFQALHHSHRHIVSNVVGADDMRIEIGPARKLCPRDTVLLASDGVFDNFYVPEIIESIRKGKLPHTAENLLQALKARMAGTIEDHPTKPDDATFIIFRRR